MKQTLTLLAFLLMANANAPGAAAQPSVCGTPPSLPTTLENSETVKGDIKGQADALSRLVGKAELQGQIEAAKKQIYQSNDKFFAAQKDAYLSYMFCAVIMQDSSLSTLQKVDAIRQFRDTPAPVTPKPQGQNSTTPRQDTPVSTATFLGRTISRRCDVLNRESGLIHTSGNYMEPTKNLVMADFYSKDIKLLGIDGNLSYACNRNITLSVSFRSDLIAARNASRGQDVNERTIRAGKTISMGEECDQEERVLRSYFDDILMLNGREDMPTSVTDRSNIHAVFKASLWEHRPVRYQLHRLDERGWNISPQEDYRDFRCYVSVHMDFV